LQFAQNALDKGALAVISETDLGLQQFGLPKCVT
jgi:hypothetical protein